MREPKMFVLITNFLRKEGYTILQENKGNTSGPDILAEKCGKKLVLQMKGDSAAIKTDWDTGLGQLLDIMDDPEANYAMAVSQFYERLVKQFPTFVKQKLNLLFLIVRDDGTVHKF